MAAGSACAYVSAAPLCPHQASWTSACAFSVGAGLPLLAGCFIPNWQLRIVSVCLVAAVTLCLFGGLGAHLGGAPLWKGSMRVFVGGCIAMGMTYGIGAAFAAVAGPGFVPAA